MGIIDDHKKGWGEFLGHIMRKNGLEELILRGSVNGKRRKGRQREKYLTKLSRWVTKQLTRREKDKVKEINLLRTAKRQKYVETLRDKAPRERERYLRVNRLFFINRYALPLSTL